MKQVGTSNHISANSYSNRTSYRSSFSSGAVTSDFYASRIRERIDAIRKSVNSNSTHTTDPSSEDFIDDSNAPINNPTPPTTNSTPSSRVTYGPGSAIIHETHEMPSETTSFSGQGHEYTLIDLDGNKHQTVLSEEEFHDISSGNLTLAFVDSKNKSYIIDQKKTINAAENQNLNSTTIQKGSIANLPSDVFAGTPDPRASDKEHLYHIKAADLELKLLKDTKLTTKERAKMKEQISEYHKLEIFWDNENVLWSQVNKFAPSGFDSQKNEMKALEAKFETMILSGATIDPTKPLEGQELYKLTNTINDKYDKLLTDTADHYNQTVTRLPFGLSLSYQKQQITTLNKADPGPAQNHGAAVSVQQQNTYDKAHLYDLQASSLELQLVNSPKLSAADKAKITQDINKQRKLEKFWNNQANFWGQMAVYNEPITPKLEEIKALQVKIDAALQAGKTIDNSKSLSNQELYQLAQQMQTKMVEANAEASKYYASTHQGNGISGPLKAPGEGTSLLGILDNDPKTL